MTNKTPFYSFKLYEGENLDIICELANPAAAGHIQTTTFTFENIENRNAFIQKIYEATIKAAWGDFKV